MVEGKNLFTFGIRFLRYPYFSTFNPARTESLYELLSVRTRGLAVAEEPCVSGTLHWRLGR